jgi:hypothetical protein
MTIKDLAEMTMNYGLVCQKCVNFTPNLKSRHLTPFQRVRSRASYNNIHT